MIKELYKSLMIELRQAMLAKNYETTTMIRGIKAKVQEYQVANRLDRDLEPSNDIMVTVIQAHKKSLEKAISQLEKAGDRAADLVKEYKTEIAFCDTYLPSIEDQQTQISNLVAEAIKDLNITGLKQLGQAMGHIMKNNSGLDGKLVKETIFEQIKALTLEG